MSDDPGQSDTVDDLPVIGTGADRAGPAVAVDIDIALPEYPGR